MEITFKFAGMPVVKAKLIRKGFLSMKQQENADAVEADVNDAFMTKCIKQYVRSKAFHKASDNNAKDFQANYTDPI